MLSLKQLLLLEKLTIKNEPYCQSYLCTSINNKARRITDLIANDIAVSNVFDIKQAHLFDVPDFNWNLIFSVMFF